MVPHRTVEQKIIEAFALDQSEGATLVVTAIPDAAKGEALVVLTTQDLAVTAIRERLAQAGLPTLWIPKEVLRVEALPLLGSGKLDFKSAQKIALEKLGAH